MIERQGLPTKAMWNIFKWGPKVSKQRKVDRDRESERFLPSLTWCVKIDFQWSKLPLGRNDPGGRKIC